jgi:hypothetical protein
MNLNNKLLFFKNQWARNPCPPSSLVVTFQMFSVFNRKNEFPEGRPGSGRPKGLCCPL